MSRLITTNDNFVLIDVTSIARQIYGHIDIYMYMECEWFTAPYQKVSINTEAELEYAESRDITIVIDGGHLPNASKFKWADAEKIAYDGNIYLRSKDILK